MLVLAILLCCLVVLAKNWLLGPIGIAVVWLFAGVFNPDLTTGTVWFIAFIVGWLLDYDID